MNYQDYIDLGFKRTDMNDSVEFKQTGYYGYCLEKSYNKKISVCLCGGELDKPKLYIKKLNSETYHIIEINCEMVKDLFCKPKNKEPFDYSVYA